MDKLINEVQLMEHYAETEAFVNGFKMKKEDNGFVLIAYIDRRKIEDRKVIMRNIKRKLEDLENIFEVRVGLIGSTKQNLGYPCALKVESSL